MAVVERLVYRLYERRLAAGLRDAILPRHVGVILDGNRRYARARGVHTSQGHRVGADKIHELLDWCEELRIPHVTLWLLSTDNLNREVDEVGDLAEIIADTITRIAADARGRRQIKAVGALDLLPDRLQEALKRAEESTAGHGWQHVQVAVGYGGRQEITDALRRMLEQCQARGDSLDQVIDGLSEEAIAEHLYTTGTPDPDLIIRTSGEIRLSGFLLWQSVHSEFHFCDAYWPEFRKTDFLRALRDFAGRKRRFGR